MGELSVRLGSRKGMPKRTAVRSGETRVHVEFDLAVRERATKTGGQTALILSGEHAVCT